MTKFNYNVRAVGEVIETTVETCVYLEGSIVTRGGEESRVVRAAGHTSHRTDTRVLHVQL